MVKIRLVASVGLRPTDGTGEVKEGRAAILVGVGSELVEVEGAKVGQGTEGQWAACLVLGGRNMASGKFKGGKGG